MRLVSHRIGLRISQGKETVELQSDNLRKVTGLFIGWNGIVECSVEGRLMLQRTFLGVRHASSVAAEMVDALIKEMWWKLGLEYQTDIHYHVFLAVNVARKIENVIGQQATPIKFSPWSWRITPPEIWARRQSSMVTSAARRVDGNTVNPTTMSVPLRRA